ncbi:MAG: PD-(D/E)XK nuclease family protein, partial [Solirubrobacteraceae bacterium]
MRDVPPREPVPLDEVARRFPTLRQSLLAKHDDCALSTLFELKFARGWNTHPQARGTVFHLFAAKVLQTLRDQQSTTIPVHEAEQILVEACRQLTDSKGQPIPARNVVRVPLRQMPELRMAARKFASDNSFSHTKITSIEERLRAPLRYVDDQGEVRTRMLTGQLDALLYEAPDGAIVIDWKDTWALPPEPKEKGPDDYVGED